MGMHGRHSYEKNYVSLKIPELGNYGCLDSCLSLLGCLGCSLPFLLLGLIVLGVIVG